MAERPYRIQTDVAFGGLELVDVGRLADDCAEPWFNQSLVTVNDCVLRVGIVKGEFHWHSHEREDEVFYVVEGELLVDVRDGEKETTTTLRPRQGYLVPRGVVHRTRAPVRTVMLMIEGKGVVPTGDEDA
jgi:mannose-6-phosphate isomerase-like protein (cupin superfamily)